MRPAHIEPLTGEEQTVAEHNKQVAALAQSFAAAAGLGTTAWLAGRLHDLGKDCDAFEAYLRAGVAGDRLVRRGDVPHAPAGMRLVLEQATASTTAARIAAEQIASAIAWHHGLGDFLTEDGKPLLAEKLLREKENNDANYQQALLALESQDFPPEALPAALVEAAAESEQLMNQILAFDKQNRYFYLSLAQRFLLSALIDADRIDTAAFFSHSPSLPPPLPDWALLADEMEQRLASLPRRSALDGKRAEISGLCLDFAKNEPGVYRLPVPTGGGKTYASFRFALAHAATHQMQHIIYVAPYLSIIEQSADNLRQITGHPEYFLEHHSNLVPEDADEYRFLTSSWQAPVIITTAVQLLNTLFSAKTGAIRRMHALAKSVIIFDEIQSLPPKCTHLFNLAMNFLAQFCGATIILCSATQPRLEESGRPLRLTPPENMLAADISGDPVFRRTRISDLTEQTMCAEDVCRLALSKEQEDHSVLVIVNTKACALRLYQQLKEVNEARPAQERFLLFHLSTAMCPAHRREDISRIRQALPQGRLICVSTALIEAGVDISFGCVIRSLAGMDSIAQAAGRCNRHGEAAAADVYIVRFSPEEESLEKLPEIHQAAEASRSLLYEYRQDPGAFQHDLLSATAMDYYYRSLYISRAPHAGQSSYGVLDYPLPALHTTIVDLLSANPSGKIAYQERTGRNPDFLHQQAPETAGRCFQVIDAETTDAVIACPETLPLLDELAKIQGITGQKPLLQQLHPYSVSLYSHQFAQLAAMGALTLGACGVWVLDQAWYDRQTGIRFSGKQLDLLCF